MKARYVTNCLAGPLDCKFGGKIYQNQEIQRYGYKTYAHKECSTILKLRFDAVRGQEVFDV